MIDFDKDYCFVIGEQFDKNNYDKILLDKLTSETTFACNYTIDNFCPTIYMAGSHTIIKHLIDSHKFNNTTTYLLSPTAIISNCYNIEKMKYWHDDPDVIKADMQNSYTHPETLKKLQKIVDENRNVFLVKDISKIILTRDLSSVIDKELLLKNLKYCDKYSNIIPMMVFKYAARRNMNTIFLLGCDVKQYPEKVRNDIHNGIKLRALKKNKINIINSSPYDAMPVDFLPNYDLNKFHKYYLHKNISIDKLVSDYANYCKIDILKKMSREEQIETILEELESITRGKDILDYDSYKKIDNL